MKNQIKNYSLLIIGIMLSYTNRASPFTDSMQQKINAIAAKQAEQNRQRQIFIEQKRIVDAANEALWASRATAGTPDEIKTELANIESALRDIRDLRGQQLNEIEWGEVDQRIDRIKYGRSSRGHSPARRKRTLHALDLQINHLEKRKQLLIALQTGTQQRTTRTKKNLPCDSLCGYAFGQNYTQSGFETDIPLKKNFRHLSSARLVHDSAGRLISVELHGGLPRSDDAFVVDELIKCIMLFEDQYGIVFPWFTNCLATSVTKNGKCFTISFNGQELSCKVDVSNSNSSTQSAQDGIIPEGVGADVL